MANLDYKERLAFLDAETLELRKLKIDLQNVHNISFDIDFNDYFSFKQDGSTRGSSGHNHCRVEKNGFVDAGCNYFAVRTIKSWKSLPVATMKLTI